MMNIFAKSVQRSIPVVQRTVMARSQLRMFSVRFTESHEYIKMVGDIGVVGISDHACEALGDIVFVDLPTVGSVFAKGDTYGSVESVKAASDVYMPVAGEVVEVNSHLEGSPETVNESPYEKGWFVKIKVSDPAEVNKLMDQATYDSFKDE